jgi:hypothetical protein
VTGTSDDHVRRANIRSSPVRNHIKNDEPLRVAQSTGDRLENKQKFDNGKAVYY